eukprot:4526554-Pyramimonas_sp.AAC.1
MVAASPRKVLQSPGRNIYGRPVGGFSGRRGDAICVARGPALDFRRGLAVAATACAAYLET